jgi:hypothetical protein
MGKHKHWGEPKSEGFYQRWTPTGLRLLKERAASMGMSLPDYLETKARQPEVDLDKLVQYHSEMIETHIDEIERLKAQIRRLEESVEFHRLQLRNLEDSAR